MSKILSLADGEGGSTLEKDPVYKHGASPLSPARKKTQAVIIVVSKMSKVNRTHVTSRPTGLRLILVCYKNVYRKAKTRSGYCFYATCS